MFYTVWACNAWIGQEESFLMKFSYLSSNLNFHFKQTHIALFSRDVFQFPEDFWVNKIREENYKGAFLGWSQLHSKRDLSFADKERLFQRSFLLIFLVPVSTVCFPSIHDKDAKKHVFQGFSFQVISMFLILSLLHFCTVFVFYGALKVLFVTWHTSIEEMYIWHKVNIIKVKWSM